MASVGDIKNLLTYIQPSKVKQSAGEIKEAFKCQSKWNSVYLGMQERHLPTSIKPQERREVGELMACFGYKVEQLFKKRGYDMTEEEIERLQKREMLYTRKD